jgi:hypothetical protein
MNYKCDRCMDYLMSGEGWTEKGTDRIYCAECAEKMDRTLLRKPRISGRSEKRATDES